MPSDARSSSVPYQDRSLAPEVRARDLLARMTIEEKLAQIVGVWSTALRDEAGFSAEKAHRELAHGIGHVSRIGASTTLRPAESARFANEIQRFLREHTRLGIPAIVHEESCAGYVARDATCFPQALGLAATFEPALVHEMATVIRAQMRAVGAHQTLAPVLDVARDPRWGRTEESFGEDPYLVAQMGIAYVRGIQGPDLAHGVVATGKHFLGYAASEGGLNWAPAHLGPRELLDVYAFPFEGAIREAQLASVMNAYHELDGIPCGASKQLFEELLRKRLGFEGVVVTDYFTVPTLAGYHRVAADKAEAAKLALEAGMDVELPQRDAYGEPLAEALRQGRIDPALVERSALRVLRQKLELGLFENPFVDAGRAAQVFDTAEQRGLARRLAVKSMVLLRNEGDLLPLDPGLRRLAVIGPSADSVRLLQGDYHYPTHLEILHGPIDESDLSPRPAGAKTNLALHFPPSVTILEGIRAALSPATRIDHARGCDTTGTSQDGFAEAVVAAQDAEAVILVVGGRSGLVNGCTSGESIDRVTLGLPGVQQALVEAVVAVGRPTVLVLVDGRPLALPWIAAHVPAMLLAWLPGEEGGNAVADVLFGRACPGGRLPISLPASVGQLPVFYAHKPSGGRSHWHGSYVDGSTKPLFPFGHGLSYGRFVYEGLSIAPDRVDAEGVVTISAEVVNEGARAGEEVVQLYLHDEVASVTRPVLELRGFARVALAPGERRRLSFELHASQLAFHDAGMARVVEPGAIEVLLGASSADVRLRGRFEITGGLREIEHPTRFTTQVRITAAPGGSLPLPG
jgi:beta-glucosidase